MLQVAALREQHVPFRAIASRLGMSLGSVQKSLRRWQQRQAVLEELEEQAAPWESLSPEQLHAMELADCLGELAADPTDELATYRLRHIPRSTPGHPWGPHQ
jgi:IS30 family transposase